jgi:hypothetical protein
MADNALFFGTSEYMTWLKCPNSGMPLSRVGWSANGTYLNGGGWARSSSTKHFEPTLTWSFLSQTEVKAIENFYLGAYGQGPFYFYDSFSMKSNVLPPYFSIARVAADDGVSLLRDKRPMLEATPANDFGLPTMSAVYELNSASVPYEIFLPIPSGYTLHFGAKGTSTGTAQFKVVDSLGVSVDTPLIPVSGTTFFNRSTSDSPSWVKISLTGLGTVTVASMSVVILPDGEVPYSNKFISGAGHSGCSFKREPQIVGYSAPQAIDYQSVTVEMIETGAWSGGE